MKLINREYLKKYSPIPLNFNTTEIELYEPIAINVWIEPLIGHYLLEELEYQIANNNLSDENATLLTNGGLWQYLAYTMCYEGLPFLWARVSEVGVTLGQADTYKSIELKDLTYIQDHLRRIIETLKEQVTEFLCNHCQSYPLFDTSACGCDCACNSNKGLKKPNPNFEIYTTPRKDTSLR